MNQTVMGLQSNPRNIWTFSPYFSFLVLLLLITSPLISALELVYENERVESGGRIKDLGRRSKIIVERLKTGVKRRDSDPDFVDVALELDSGLGIFDAFFASFSMILVSEIGDETFIIAALMAMRHPKSIVLSGAFSALFVMTILSTGLGRIVPTAKFDIKEAYKQCSYSSLCFFWASASLYCVEIRFKSFPEKGNRGGGDHFDIDETTNGLTELSIDEPQLEGVVFEEEFEDLEEVEDVVEE